MGATRVCRNAHPREASLVPRRKWTWDDEMPYQMGPRRHRWFEVTCQQIPPPTIFKIIWTVGILFSTYLCPGCCWLSLIPNCPLSNFFFNFSNTLLTKGVNWFPVPYHSMKDFDIFFFKWFEISIFYNYFFWVLFCP